MPKKFVFKNPSTGQVKYECPINKAAGRRGCVQCQATRGAKFQQPTIPGQPRCRRNTCLNSLFCFQHLVTVCHLRVANSDHLQSMGIRDGLGLYAYYLPAQQRRLATSDREPVFKRGQIITSGIPGHPSLYDGEHTTREQLNARYDYIDSQGRKCAPTAPYAIEIDGPNNRFLDAACQRGPLASANDPKVSRGMARIAPNGEMLSNGTLRILRDIPHGTEILVRYGRDYWKPTQCEEREGVRRQPRRRVRAKTRTNNRNNS